MQDFQMAVTSSFRSCRSTISLRQCRCFFKSAIPIHRDSIPDYKAPGKQPQFATKLRHAVGGYLGLVQGMAVENQKNRATSFMHQPAQELTHLRHKAQQAFGADHRIQVQPETLGWPYGRVG